MAEVNNVEEIFKNFRLKEVVNEMLDTFSAHEILDALNIDPLDVVRFYGESDILQEIDVSDVVANYGDDILSEFEDEHLVSYLDMQGYDWSNVIDESKLAENCCDEELLSELCHRHCAIPTKERMKEIVNTIIDDLPNKIY